MKKTVVLLLALFGFVAHLPAAIPVKATGAGPFAFGTLPTAAQGWTTLSVGTAATTITTEAGLDVAVERLGAAAIVTPLGQSATVTPAPSANLIARWNSVNLNLQTRPSGNDFIVLMAKLENTASSAIKAFTLSYDLGALVAVDSTITEDVPGHRVYYSLTGAVGSWTHIPELDSPAADDSGAKSATLDLRSAPWGAGGFLYLLWADDNGPASDTAPTREGAYTIDNLTISSVEIEVGPPVILEPPSNVSTNEYGIAELSVVASGAGLTYQWFKGTPPGGAAVASATKPTLVLTNLAGSGRPWSTPADGGQYYVRVSGTQGAPASSPRVTATVTPDTIAPTLIYALCNDTNASQVIVRLSEPLDDRTGAVSDPGHWAVETSDGATGLGISKVLYDGTNSVWLTTTLPLNSASTYRVRTRAELVDRAQARNPLLAGRAVLVSCAEVELLPLVAVWHYADDDVDPGANWVDAGFDDSSWFSGQGPFDAKRNAAGTAGANCRNTTLYQLGDVGTCLRLYSPITETNQPSVYFRTHFNFDGGSEGTLLKFQGKCDDSAAIYLNGTELARIGLPAGVTLTHEAFSEALGGRPAVGDGDPQDVVLLPPGALLQSGDNVLAVLLKQSSLASSDLTMGLRVSALVASSVGGPALLISYDGSEVTLTWSPDGGTLQFKNDLGDAAWTDLPGAVSGYTTSASEAARFYRVRQ